MRAGQCTCISCPGTPSTGRGSSTGSSKATLSDSVGSRRQRIELCKEGTVQPALADDGHERADPQLIVIGDRYGDRCPARSLLHDDVAAPLTDLFKPVIAENGAHRAPAVRSHHTATCTRVTSTSSLNLCFNSSSEAVSKNNSRASIKLVRASSIVSPWLATSSSGQSETYPFPSRSMMAVNSRLVFMRRGLRIVFQMYVG